MTPPNCPHKPRDPKAPCQECRAIERKAAKRAEKKRTTLERGTDTARQKIGARIASNAAGPRKPVKKVSDLMVKQRKAYKKQRAAFLTYRFVCEVHGCNEAATDVHHKAGRIGKLLLDESLWLPVCRACHQKIETSPAWAKANNYSVSRLTLRK